MEDPMHQDSTLQNPDPCDCAPCTFIRVMADHLPRLPQDLYEMSDALALVLLSPEAREAFKPVIRQFDGMGRRGRKETAKVIEQMDATQRSLAILLLNPETRDALRSMVRAADLGRI